MNIYGLYSSLSINIGDDIQTFALEQLIGKVNGYVDREKVATDERSGILIANGWWKHQSEDFPPHSSLRPVYIGFHVTHSLKWVQQHRDHFIKYGPIGCRDPWTLSLMKFAGIPSYLSGCLTLSLRRWDDVNSNGQTLAVDVPHQVKLPSDTIRLSHEGPISSHPSVMRPLTLDMLTSFQRASLVVTTRLHVALPCLAFGTPVVFMTEHPKDPRFGALENLVPIRRIDDSWREGYVMSEAKRREEYDNLYRNLRVGIDRAKCR